MARQCTNHPERGLAAVLAALGDPRRRTLSLPAPESCWRLRPQRELQQVCLASSGSGDSATATSWDISLGAIEVYTDLLKRRQIKERATEYGDPRGVRERHSLRRHM
jgi:hypothetical protein